MNNVSDSRAAPGWSQSPAGRHLGGAAWCAPGGADGPSARRRRRDYARFDTPGHGAVACKL